MKYALTLVCADRGQHPSRMLGKVIDQRGRHTGRIERASGVTREQYRELNEHLQIERERDGERVRKVVTEARHWKNRKGVKGWKFSCQTCGREYRVTETKLDAVIAGGLLVVDLASLSI